MGNNKVGNVNPRKEKRTSPAPQTQRYFFFFPLSVFCMWNHLLKVLDFELKSVVVFLVFFLITKSLCSGKTWLWVWSLKCSLNRVIVRIMTILFFWYRPCNEGWARWLASCQV